MSLALYVLFLGGPAWPFRVAAVICLLAAIEEITISWILPEPESNLRSVWDILKRSVRNDR